jgi:Phage P2 baseplate assembly protein gpV
VFTTVNLNNLIRIGKVSSIHYDAGTVAVCFEDKDSIVTDDLPMLSFEYYMPDVGDPVLCLFLGNGLTKGFCLGKYFYDKDGEQPMESGEGIFYKHFFKEGSIKYDKSAKTLTIYADTLDLKADTKIVIESSKDISVKASGDVTVEASSATVKANSVDLGDSGGMGVVTGECICCFSGSPHPDVSSKVKAVK